MVDPHQPSRSLGCCSYHAWQLLAEDWVAGRFRLRFRLRYYRCHHREESLALEEPPSALVHLAGLAEVVGHFQQGSGALALCHHHDGNLVLQVRQEACGPLHVEAEEAHRTLRLPHQGPRPSSVSQVLIGFPGSPPHLRLEVGRVEDRQTRQDDRAAAAQTSHHAARSRDSVASPTSPG